MPLYFGWRMKKVIRYRDIVRIQAGFTDGLSAEEISRKVQQPLDIVNDFKPKPKAKPKAKAKKSKKVETPKTDEEG